MTSLCLGFTVKKMKLLWKPLLVLLLAVAQQGYGCLPEGSNGKVTIGQKTYVCLVFNSESIVVVEAIADQFTRFVVADSYSQATDCTPFYFPNGCATTASTTTAAPSLSSTLQPTAAPSSEEITSSNTTRRLVSNGAALSIEEEARDLQSSTCQPSLYYGESMGVKAIYQKSYATCPPNVATARFAPVVTLVVQVNRGVVESVIWDDGCFGVCPNNPNSATTCMQNSFSLTNNTPIATIPDLGQDCASTKAKCDSSSPGSCDLTVYVVWTGIDANGNYFSSAGRRPSRFTQFGLGDAANVFQF